MRVLYIWDADYPWDVRTEKICATLMEAGHDVHIAARNRQQQPAVETLPEGTVHRMPAWRIVPSAINALSGFPAFMNPRWYALISRSIRESRAQLVIVRDLPLCPLAIALGRRHGVPIMLDMAENYPAMLRKLWETSRARALDRLVRNPRLASVIERHCLPRADRVLVVIEEAAVHARRLGVPESRLHVVSNTPPRTRALHDGQPRGSIDVGYLGIMEVDRGLVDAIDALALLAQRGMRVRARFVGAGRDLELLMNRAAAHGLGPDRLEFTGYVTGHARALELVAESRIGLLPHHATEWAETTIPNKLFDYMAAGIPVLSSDNTPCARILSTTGAGRTFRAGDVTALADAVTDMLGDEQELMNQGAAGRAAVLRRYNWEYDSAELLRAIELTVSAAPRL